MERTCSQCGYDLAGLGAVGKCPECGQFYSAISGAGLAETTRGRAGRSLDLAARLRTITFGLFTLAILGCGGVASAFADNPYRPLALAAVVGTVGIMATVTSYLYEHEE